MRQSVWTTRYVTSFVLGVSAPAVVLMIVLHRVGRRRFLKALVPVKAKVAATRQDWLSEFSLYELVTGEIQRVTKR